jgi:hypothetical protein
MYRLVNNNIFPLKQIQNDLEILPKSKYFLERKANSAIKTIGNKQCIACRHKRAQNASRSLLVKYIDH